MTRLYTPPETGADHRPCAVDQQRSQISIPALADPLDVRPASAGRHARRKTEPRREVACRGNCEASPTAAISAVAVNGPTPGAVAKAATLPRFAFVPCDDLPVDGFELPRQCIKVFEQRIKSRPSFARQNLFIGSFMSRRKAATRQMPFAATIPNSPRSPRAEFTVAVRCRTSSARTWCSVSRPWLSFDLIGTKRMFGRPTAFADGFGIGRIRLVSLHVGLGVLRRYQTYIVPQRNSIPRAQ